MTPEFASLVNPTFHAVLRLLDEIEQNRKPNLQEERGRLREELNQASMTASSDRCRVKAEEFELAKQALIFWADEVLTVAEPAWRDCTLEFEFYNSRDRAWKFFVDGHSKALDSTADVIETWYLALVLGFEGDIRDAFHQHLGESSLPGGVEDAEEARFAFAKRLQKRIQQSRPQDLVADPLEGDVRELVGGTLLRRSVQLLLVLAAILFLLFMFAPPSS